MTSVIQIFVVFLGVAAGIGIGWYIRGRPEAAPDTDPEVELRELREVHATCGTKIRNLHIELTKAESALAIAGLTPDRPAMSMSPARADDSPPGSNGAAARLASIIDALGTDESADDDSHGPTAFKTILPANLVEEGVKEAAEAEAAGDLSDRDLAEDDLTEASRPSDAMVIHLLDDSNDDVAIRVDHRDDLKMIKGIGPKIESVLHEQGITTFQQIAELDDDAISQLDEVLGAFRGRIERDDWVGSARDLMVEHSVSR